MGLAKNVIIIERGLWATIARGIFGAGSGFRVGWGTAGAGGEGWFLSFCGFFAGIGGIFILVGGMALGYHSMGFRHFPDVS